MKIAFVSVSGKANNFAFWYVQPQIVYFIPILITSKWLYNLEQSSMVEITLYIF